jgi:hypothetical protein
VEGDTKKTSYIWDSMDEEDRVDTIDILKESDEWVISKSKDKWSSYLTVTDYEMVIWYPLLHTPQTTHNVTFIVSSLVHCGIGSEEGFCSSGNIRRQLN